MKTSTPANKTTARSGNKTQPTNASVAAYLAAIADPVRREDANTLVEIMQRATGMPPAMWGNSMVGFGHYHYRYESGREGDMFLVGFAARKSELVVYVMPGFDPYPELMQRLGRYKTGKSCLYLKSLADVDRAVLERLVERSARAMGRKARA